MGASGASHDENHRHDDAGCNRMRRFDRLSKRSIPSPTRTTGRTRRTGARADEPRAVIGLPKALRDSGSAMQYRPTGLPGASPHELDR